MGAASGKPSSGVTVSPYLAAGMSGTRWRNPAAALAIAAAAAVAATLAALLVGI
jgi:hypothetical protein